MMPCHSEEPLDDEESPAGIVALAGRRLWSVEDAAPYGV